MKKLLSAFAGIIMAAVLTLGVAAATENSLSCSASSGTLKTGDTVTVTVSMKNSDAFKAMGLSFEYDKNAFSLESGKWLLTGTLISDVDIENNKAALSYKNAVTQNGKIFELILKVKDSAVTGDYTVKLEPVMKNGGDIITAAGASVNVHIDGKAPTSSSGSTGSSRPDDSSKTSSVGTAGGADSSQVTASDGQTDISSTASDSASGEPSGSESTSNFGEQSNGGDKQDESGNAVMWVLIAVGAVVVAGAVAVVIIVKVKRK